MLSKARLLFDTVKHLKFTQIYHQIYYRLMKPKKLGYYSDSFKWSKFIAPNLKFVDPTAELITNNTRFNFLNLSKEFTQVIDWDFQEFGKLWNYNLQYFNYLQQSGLSNERKQFLIFDIVDWLESGRLRLEPYPVSLRVMNTIRYCSSANIQDSKILKPIYGQIRYLRSHLEYHLLGNHLLENAFALMMGGVAFNVVEWQDKAKEILEAELREQILDDGGHFELSPMYHQIILFRILELIEYYSLSPRVDEPFLEFIKNKTNPMLSWLKAITFRNGDIPHLNDSADEITLRSTQLFEFAKTLGLEEPARIKLKTSGYRKFETQHYECVVDVGPVGPSYQPGHSHADALTFILYSQNRPVLVEAGTSTYQIGERRKYERSTAAHNTVVVGGRNQSEVWGGFRVGKRATVNILSENESTVIASHDGYYKAFGILHKRSFYFEENNLEIIDEIESIEGKFYLHFHPNCHVSLLDQFTVVVAGLIKIVFQGAQQIQLKDYMHADGYNRYSTAKELVVDFKDRLNTSIYFTK